MATLDLGKIKQVWRGTYNNGTAYVVDDLVAYTDSGITSTYICVANSTGNAPSSSGTAHASWNYVAKGVTDPIPSQSGNAGKVLKTDGSSLSFGTGGGIAQVATDIDKTTGTLSLGAIGNYADIPNLTVTLTPASSSSKFLISFQVYGEPSNGGSQAYHIALKRAISGGATTQIRGDGAGNRAQVFTQAAAIYSSGDNDSTPEIAQCPNYLDSPSTSSAVTYSLQMTAQETASTTFYYNRSVGDSNTLIYERGMSWITVQEVVV